MAQYWAKEFQSVKLKLNLKKSNNLSTTVLKYIHRETGITKNKIPGKLGRNLVTKNWELERERIREVVVISFSIPG